MDIERQRIMIGKEYSNGGKKKWVEIRRREDGDRNKNKKSEYEGERAPLRLCCRMLRIMSSFLKKSYLERDYIILNL